MAFTTHFAHSTAALLICLLCGLQLEQTGAVNMEKYATLGRDDLLELDRETTRYFLTDYQQMDTLNVSYDQALFNSIRSIRHTVVLNLFDYTYTSGEIIARSQGPRANRENCRRDLKLLAQMASDLWEKRSSDDSDHTKVPMSAINFIEANGRAESGVLNGNFIWWGSPSTCDRGLINELAIANYLKSKRQEVTNVGPIRGRYCVTHLRAHSWPTDDKYFGARLNLKVGVCVPDSCHTAQYMADEESRQLVDILVRRGLTPPFNSDRYTTDYLFCLPDEESEFRQWDFGTKALIVFVALWVLVLVYTNYKYQKRQQMLQKLDEYDIRVLISQQKQASDNQQENAADSSGDEVKQQVPSFKQKVYPPSDIKETQTTSGEQKKDSGSLIVPPEPSPYPSPLPSDIEENDGEFNVLRPIVKPSRRSFSHNQSQKQQSAGQNSPSSSPRSTRAPPRDRPKNKGVDFIGAFSVEANLSFLFKPKAEPGIASQGQRKRRSLSTARTSSISAQDMRKLSQQLSAINRRTSSSNEALLSKRYDEQEAQMEAQSTPRKVEGSSERKRRVDIDVLDGLKVFATLYIVCGHTMMFFFGSVADLRFGDERMLDATMAVLLNSLQVVGLFYIITGTLMTFLAFSRMKKRQLTRPSFWLLVIVGRYIRLIPSYLLVFWFARHAAPFTGSGFGWHDYRTDIEHNRGYCATESWWTMLTMSAADIKIPLDCVPQTWYLSNDFRTLLVLPFYVATLALNQTVGYVAIFATIIMSSIKMVSTLTSANIDYNILLRWQPHVYSLMADRLHDVYTDLAIRLSTYLLGVVVGHLLYLYETRQIRDWPHWVRSYGIKVALTTALTFFFGAVILASPLVNQFLPAREDIDSNTAVVLIPTFKTAMEVCLCVILLLLVTGGGYKWFRLLLTSKMFEVLSRISYGVFLVHIEVMYKIPATKFESNWFYLFLYSLFFVVASNVVAFIMYVLYEMPIQNLIRYGLKRALKLVC